MSEYPLEPLGNICEINPDTLTEASDPTRRYRYIDLSSIKEHKADLSITPLPFAVLPSRARRGVAFNDVLLGTVRPNLKNFAIIESEDNDLLCSTGFAVLRSKKNISDPRFIFHVINSEIATRQLNALVTGSNYPAVNVTQVADLLIPIPPLPEQKKIAEILSGIDRVINGYMKQLKHRKLFYGSFLDKEISVSKSTRNLVPIGEVAIQSKKKGIGDLPIYSVSVEHGMIRRDSLERSLISSLDQKDNLYASEGDFCYNMMRMWQGASGIAPTDCLVSPAYVVCRPTNAVLPEYLAITCRSKELIDKFRVSSRGITSDRWRLYYEDFAKIEIPLPDKSEQSAIITRNKALLGSTYKLEEYLQKAIRLKESISSDLLSGRKRVSDARILEGVGI